MELREYQTDHIGLARNAIANGNRKLIMQGPTGSGKTIEAAAISKGAVDKGNNVLFLVNKRDLVYQARDRFESFGLGQYISLIMSGEETDHSKQIKIGTIQTYHRRLKLDQPGWVRWFHKAQVVIIDEAHSSVCRTYLDVINKHKKDAVILGLTATPTRSDGRGLGKVYDQIVCCEGIEILTQKGYLVPMVYFVPDKPDLSKIRTVAGDYDKKQLGSKMDKPKLVGNIYEQWARISPERQTIIFAVNVKHSHHIKNQFEKYGVSIAHIDAHTPQDEREEIYEKYLDKRTQVLTNVGIATEGSDLPITSCIVIARPTKSYGLYIQMAGRGSRPAEGKKDCILIDHAGCWWDHGSIDDQVEWTLEDTEKAWKKKTNKKREKRYLVCEYCSHAFNGKRCPNCGHEVENYGKKIAELDADLVPTKKQPKQLPTQDKRRWYAMLSYEMRRLGKTDKWLLAQYKTKTGVWPRNMENVSPIEPNQEVKNWLTSQRIRWIKRKQKEEQNAT